MNQRNKYKFDATISGFTRPTATFFIKYTNRSLGIDETTFYRLKVLQA